MLPPVPVMMQTFPESLAGIIPWAVVFADAMGCDRFGVAYRHPPLESGQAFDPAIAAPTLPITPISVSRIVAAV